MRRCRSRRATCSRPQDVMKTSGADILRLWVASADTTNDIRFGPAIVQSAAEAYRKLRNTLRWMLGALALLHARPHRFRAATLPELERLMLHRLAEPRRRDPRRLRGLRLPQGHRRAVALHEHGPVGVLFRHPQGHALLRGLFERQAPRGADGHRPDLRLRLLVAGADPLLHGRGSLARPLSRRAEGSVHLQTFPADPGRLARRRAGRQVGDGARRPPRRHGRARARARRQAHRLEPRSRARDLHHRHRRSSKRCTASISPRSAITSAATLVRKRAARRAPSRSPTCRASASSCKRAPRARKCARSWRITEDVGSDPDYPDLSARDAAAVREFDLRASRAG